MRWTRTLASLALLLLPTLAAHAAPALSSCTVTAASIDACRTGAAAALGASGYGSARSVGNGLGGSNDLYSAAIFCCAEGDQAVANIVVAGPGDASAECTRIAQAFRGSGDRVLRSRYLEVILHADGAVTLGWHDTPGNPYDWISAQPAGTPDDKYSAGYWNYTEGEVTGSRERSFDPGNYELRIYFDYPKGGYVVRDRLPFSVGP
jgi:hypothetical protein